MLAVQSTSKVTHKGLSWAAALVLATKSARRRATGYFLVERSEVLAQVLAAQWAVVQLFIANEAVQQHIKKLCQLHKRPLPPLTLLSAKRMARLCYRKTADVVAVVQARPYQLQELSIRAHSFIFVLDALEKPGNIGAIIRCAAAVRADAVISLSETTDWFNPNIVRNSIGACFQVPLIHCTPQPFFAWAKEVGIQCVSAEPHAQTTYWDANFCQPTALLLGNEHSGLRTSVAGAALCALSVPMQKGVDSLNVADVATLMAYEARRQQAWPKRSSL